MEYIYEGYLTLKLKVNGRKLKLVQNETYDLLNCEMDTISTTRPDLFPQFVRKEDKGDREIKKPIKKIKKRKIGGKS
jgi:hypothetical protein